MIKKTLLILLFVSCSNEPLHKFNKPIEIVYTDYQLEILEAFNSAREVNGLQPLKAELMITHLAEGHSKEMDSLQNANHNFLQQRADIANAQNFGEIVTYGYITANSQIGAILGSASHRLQLLGDYTHIGIYKQNQYLTIELAKYEKN
jgi:uncharacterized protein YkwD